MKHLCHSVVPGAHRLVTPMDNEQVLAFVNPDGLVTIVLANRSNEAQSLSLNYQGRYLNINLPPHSFHSITF